jgi:hypothetical protein
LPLILIAKGLPFSAVLLARIFRLCSLHRSGHSPFVLLTTVLNFLVRFGLRLAKAATLDLSIWLSD